MKLNLGCGFHKLPGFLNVDKQAACEPDRVIDLEQLPWPFEDNSVEEVLASHVLEHLGQQTEVFLGIMRELYRVMKPGATARIVVPHPRSDDFLDDPTHVRPVTPGLLLLFSKKENRSTLAKGAANTPLALYLDIDFEIVQPIQLNVSPEYVGKEQRELDRLAKERINVVREIDVTIRKIPPAAF